MPDDADRFTGAPSGVRRQVAAQTSTDNWETLLHFKVFGWTLLAIYLENLNTNGNSVDFRIQGSLDGGDNYDHTMTSATSLGSGSTTFQKFVDMPFTDVRVQIQATTGGSQDDVEAKATAKS